MNSKKVFYKSYFQKYLVTTEDNHNSKIYESKSARRRDKIEKLTEKSIEYMQLETVWSRNFNASAVKWFQTKTRCTCDRVFFSIKYHDEDNDTEAE